MPFLNSQHINYVWSSIILQLNKFMYAITCSIVFKPCQNYLKLDSNSKGIFKTERFWDFVYI